MCSLYPESIQVVSLSPELHRPGGPLILKVIWWNVYCAPARWKAGVARDLEQGRYLERLSPRSRILGEQGIWLFISSNIPSG